MRVFKVLFGTKRSKAWFIAAVAVSVLVLAVNLVLTQNTFIYNTVNSVFGGEIRKHVSGDPSQYTYYEADYKNKAETLAAANKLNERIVEEGIVLLKNENGALPVKTPVSDGAVSVKPKISVFGKNSVNLVYGGSGSGDAGSAGAATIYQSLESAGYECNPALKRFYESAASGAGRPATPAMGDILAGFATGETPYEAYTQEVKNSCASYNDAALIVFSRIGGEGYDLPRTMKTSFADNAAPVSGARSAGDHYLQLDKNETDLIAQAAAGFDKIIVVINSSTPMELGFLDDGAPSPHYAYSDKIKAALWVGGTGKTGINAFGRVLNGSVNPSGKTVDTYARDFKADPSWANFGNNLESNGNRYFVDGKQRAYYYVEYEEGIYVGYRYWETRGFTDGEEWYKDHVVYPMGYGLSYTNFGWEFLNAGDLSGAGLNADSTVTLRVRVTNTGDCAGKDVVQVYLTAPYTAPRAEGGVEKPGIEKPHVVLVGFEKTPLLYPASEAGEGKPNAAIVEISVPVYYFASYDYNDANKNGYKGYEIEAGDYVLKVSRDAHTPEAEAALALGEMKIQTDAATGGEVVNRFDDVSGHIAKYMSRADFSGTFPQKPTEAERNVPQSFIDSFAYTADDANQKWTAETTPAQAKNPLSYNDTKVKLYDLIGKPYDDALWDELLNQLTVKQMVDLIGTGNYNTMRIDNIAKPQTIDPDGPVGFTMFMNSPIVYDTCFYASGCVVGATYNKELACEMGEMIGNEGIIGNEKGDGRQYSGWYAPAVNIHRSQFSGRNWEYYSEDGYLSGVMAANAVRGAKSKGVYAYVKHFALNDQETNRSNNGILVWANEQAMREIYFRAFEVTVKDGGAVAVMSSFNRIGKVWAGGSYELLTEVLRGEWGFTGMVITDYNYDTKYMNVDQMIRAGGDLNLSQANFPGNTNSATQVTALRNATHNILYTVANSNAMNGLGAGVLYRYTMPNWVKILLCADGAVILALGVPGFFVIKRSRKILKKREEGGAAADKN
ncbi:MAG: glycoside hydrolase family 3 C-terminal domain-containing protein [Clostridiales bacterium]|jgi:beta-glucosidase|nr:glycoside hydrolase family 3 C-terminal domain-containing protein [Clostridiales bacterium]